MGWGEQAVEGGGKGGAERTLNKTEKANEDGKFS